MSSPICFLKMEPYLWTNFISVPSGEREEEEMRQQDTNIFCSDGKKTNKTPQVIRRWK